MKKGLQDRSVEVVPVTKVDKKYAKQVDAIIAEATAQALENYNSKVDAWNEWAAVNGGEILSKKQPSNSVWPSWALVLLRYQEIPS